MSPSEPTSVTIVTRADSSPGPAVHAEIVEADEQPGVPLFRSEALADHRTQWLGPVLLVPKRSHRLCTLVAMIAMAAILGLLCFGEFTRKARVNGWLMPQQGLVRVFAPQPGIVIGLYAREGARVRKGERLLKLSSELESATLGATQAEVIRRLTELRQTLSNERQQEQRLLVQQQQTYANRLSALHSELAQLARDVETMQERLALSAHNAAVSRDLRKQGYISEQQLQLVEGQRLENESQLGALRREQLARKREQVTLEGELKDLPVKTQSQLATIERDMAAAEEQLAQAEARREIVVTAPAEGIVTTILVEQGGHAGSSAPLFYIVPAGSSLEAHLYSPSRAVGFVHRGQRVLLRYQAYPYQKFGHYEGVVQSISRSAVSPGELPPQLSGVTGREPVYRITVKLARQSITAYGREVGLQPGMQLEADIALDTRQLYEWVLDPLYTITGKWQG